MTDNKSSTGVWFVYDGECPLCSMTAKAIQIKKKFGAVHLVDARCEETHPLVEQVYRDNIDLDEGIVIFEGGRVYHGDAAMKFIAKHGSAENYWMVLSKAFFHFDLSARLLYPLLRAIRGLLLRMKDVENFSAIQPNQPPIFQAAFGKSWDALPPVLMARYALAPYSHGQTTMRGKLSIKSRAPLSWAGPLLSALGWLPICNKSDIPVTVVNKRNAHSAAYVFDRKFQLTPNKTYSFVSRIKAVRENELVEIMRFGFTWKMKLYWEDNKVVMAHKGYGIWLFGWLVPLPLTWLIGKGYAEEVAIDERTFQMLMHITHPLFGEIYSYQGRFELSE